MPIFFVQFAPYFTIAFEQSYVHRKTMCIKWDELHINEAIISLHLNVNNFKTIDTNSQLSETKVQIFGTL